MLCDHKHSRCIFSGSRVFVIQKFDEWKCLFLVKEKRKKEREFEKQQLVFITIFYFLLLIFFCGLFLLHSEVCLWLQIL